ncbi:MAG: hypothetical protein AAFZ38_08750, partial [Myxococcota bacterium]
LLTRAIPGARVRAAIEPGREHSQWFITIDCESKDIPGAIQGLIQELSDVRNEGIDNERFEDARRRLGQLTPGGLETREARARFLSTLFVYDIGLEAYGSFMMRIRELTTNDMTRVAREHLKPGEASNKTNSGPRGCEDEFAVAGVAGPDSGGVGIVSPGRALVWSKSCLACTTTSLSSASPVTIRAASRGSNAFCGAESSRSLSRPLSWARR